MLDAAVDLATTGPAERPGHGRHETERHAGAATVAGPGAEDRGPDAERLTVAPLEGRRGGGVDVDDREVAVAVPAGNGAAEAATVGERDGDLVTAQVVGIGQDLAGGDDDAGAARAAADPDDRWADAVGDGGDGGLEVFDGGHSVCAPGDACRVGDRLVTCNLLLTLSDDKPRSDTYHRSHA